LKLAPQIFFKQNFRLNFIPTFPVGPIIHMGSASFF
jgi:hypothetical protein